MWVEFVINQHSLWMGGRPRAELGLAWQSFGFLRWRQQETAAGPCSGAVLEAHPCTSSFLSTSTIQSSNIQHKQSARNVNHSLPLTSNRIHCCPSDHFCQALTCQWAAEPKAHWQTCCLHSLFCCFCVKTHLNGLISCLQDSPIFTHLSLFIFTANFKTPGTIFLVPGEINYLFNPLLCADSRCFSFCDTELFGCILSLSPFPSCPSGCT